MSILSILLLRPFWRLAILLGLPLIGLTLVVVLTVWLNILAIPAALVEWAGCCWSALLYRLHLRR